MKLSERSKAPSVDGKEYHFFSDYKILLRTTEEEPPYTVVGIVGLA